MKKMFSFHARKAGNAIASFALLAGFAAFVILVAQPTVPGDTLGAQAGRPGAAPAEATAPGSPRLDTATAGDGQVTLEWSAPQSDGGSAITNYVITYTDESRKTRAVNTESVVTSYDVTSLTNGMEYSFTIAAVNARGASKASNSLSATPQVSATVPDAPTELSATAGDGSIDVIWVTPVHTGGSDITGYVLSYTPDRGVEVEVDLGRVTAHTITGLTNDVQYTITVSAKNSIGKGASSSAVSATPEGLASTPGVPTNISASPVSQGARLTWTAPVDDGGSAITGYMVSYTAQGDSERTLEVGNVTTYDLTDLINGVRYTVMIAAQNANGDSEYSASTTFTPSTIPDAPANISITGGDKTLAISWDAPTQTGGSVITGYTISYISSGEAEVTVSVPGNALSYTLENLTNGVQYTVKILATNANGNSTYSRTTTGTPDENTPPTIVGLPSVVPSDRSAVISWSTNKNTSTRVNFGLLNITTETPEYNRNTRVVNHTVTVNDLVPCTTYSYRVRSYDSSSREAIGSEQTFTTTGCVASVQEIKRDSVDTTEGGTLDFASSSQDVRTRLMVPANLKTGETDVVFQVKKLEKEATKEEIGKPDTRVEWLGEHVYNLTAYGSESTEVNNFDNPITVTIEYSREDIQGFDLNTLKIHHFEEGIGWRSLESCENSYNPTTGTGEISCQTSSFSIFGLFGENATGSGSSSTGTYLPSSVASASGVNTETQKNTEQEVEMVLDENDPDVNTTPSNLMLPTFTQDLWIGMNNSLDVFNLQKFLNAQGFILAQDGPGSPGRETSYFGPRTQNALKRFQETYSDAMFEMFGVRPNTSGNLGQWTRKFIELQLETN